MHFNIFASGCEDFVHLNEEAKLLLLQKIDQYLNNILAQETDYEDSDIAKFYLSEGFLLFCLVLYSFLIAEFAYMCRLTEWHVYLKQDGLTLLTVTIAKGTSLSLYVLPITMF